MDVTNLGEEINECLMKLTSIKNGRLSLLFNSG